MVKLRYSKNQLTELRDCVAVLTAASSIPADSPAAREIQVVQVVRREKKIASLAILREQAEGGTRQDGSVLREKVDHEEPQQQQLGMSPPQLSEMEREHLVAVKQLLETLKKDKGFAFPAEFAPAGPPAYLSLTPIKSYGATMSPSPKHPTESVRQQQDYPPTPSFDKLLETPPKAGNTPASQLTWAERIGRKFRQGQRPPAPPQISSPQPEQHLPAAATQQQKIRKSSPEPSQRRISLNHEITLKTQVITPTFRGQKKKITTSTNVSRVIAPAPEDYEQQLVAEQQQYADWLCQQQQWVAHNFEALWNYHAACVPPEALAELQEMYCYAQYLLSFDSAAANFPNIFSAAASHVLRTKSHGAAEQDLATTPARTAERSDPVTEAKIVANAQTANGETHSPAPSRPPVEKVKIDWLDTDGTPW